MKLAKMLVPLDGSALAETVLPFVRKIAGPLGAEAVILHVVPRATLDAVTLAKEVGAEDQILKDLDVRRYLEPLAEKFKADGIRVSTRAQIGDPRTDIVATAREINADLIAMTTHGGTGLGTVLLGSVTQAVLHASPVPVILFGINATIPASLQRF